MSWQINPLIFSLVISLCGMELLERERGPPPLLSWHRRRERGATPPLLCVKTLEGGKNLRGLPRVGAPATCPFLIRAPTQFAYFDVGCPVYLPQKVRIFLI